MSEKIVQLNEEVIKGQLKELVRGSVEETLNELLEQEAEKLTQAARYERNEARQGYRSGHYDRNLTTTSGDVTLHVPRLKGVSFETAIIERLNRDIRRRTRVVGAFPDGNSAFKIARYQLFPINKKPAPVKRLTLFCVGVTYLPRPSPAKYCQQK